MRLHLLHCKKILTTRRNAAQACAGILERSIRRRETLLPYANVQILCAMKLHSITTPVVMTCAGR